MSVALIPVVTGILGLVLMITGLVVVDREKGTTTVKKTGNRKSMTKTPTSVKGEVFVGKKVAVRRKGSISAIEVGKRRAHGETEIPRAVAKLVIGFTLIVVSVGAFMLLVGSSEPGLLIAGAVFTFGGLSLPFGWFRKEQEAKAEALAR